MILVGITVPSRPGRSNDQRAFGPRSRVGQPGFSKERNARWEATPELVSQDRERVHWGLRVFRGPGYEHRQILRSAQWGLAAMPAPISFQASRCAGCLQRSSPLSRLRFSMRNSAPLPFRPEELRREGSRLRFLWGVRRPERCGLCPIGARATHSFIEAVLRRRLSAHGPTQAKRRLPLR